MQHLLLLRRKCSPCLEEVLINFKTMLFSNYHLVAFEPGASHLPGTGLLRLKVQAKQPFIFLSQKNGLCPYFDRREFCSHLIGPGEPPYEGLQGGGAPGELLPRHLGKVERRTFFRDPEHNLDLGI